MVGTWIPDILVAGIQMPFAYQEFTLKNSRHSKMATWIPDNPVAGIQMPFGYGTQRTSSFWDIAQKPDLKSIVPNKPTLAFGIQVSNIKIHLNCISVFILNAVGLEWS